MLLNKLLPCTLAIASLPLLANEAIHLKQAPNIDGLMEPKLWEDATWYPIDKHIIGEYPSKEDFSGRYKLGWDKDKLYLLAEIQDDRLVDTHPDPKQNYWDDDCLEVFIDEDASGGIHTHNYNAFAYHVALDNQVADIGPGASPDEGEVVLLNDHVESRWQRNQDAPFKITWELAISIYDDSYTTHGEHEPVKLTKGKKLGFMLAYCDSDSDTRDHFIGSHVIKPKNGDKNLGYIDASVFGELVLKGKK